MSGTFVSDFTQKVKVFGVHEYYINEVFDIKYVT